MYVDSSVDELFIVPFLFSCQAEVCDLRCIDDYAKVLRPFSSLVSFGDPEALHMLNVVTEVPHLPPFFLICNLVFYLG